ncbi:MAG TPA: nucleotidyltransferase domain-containing protein [Ignavibacteria bacterium]|nr:nucleotidyltransferase domain-containing protein [Ignavibacteria bacterium]
MTEKEKDITQKIKDKIREKDPDAKVILYGSRARGDYRENSDWDILILVDRESVSLKTEQEYRHHLLDLELEIGEPISVTVHSKKRWESEHSITLLYNSIKQEGVVLT